MQQDVLDDCPLVSWLVWYSSAAYRRHKVGDDGLTCRQRAGGGRSVPATAEFGERIWYLPIDGGELNPGAPFCSGFYLGHANALVLANEGHVVRCRTFRRRHRVNNGTPTS